MLSKTNLPINLHGQNTSALPASRKDQCGRVLIRQQHDYATASVADFSTAVLKSDRLVEGLLAFDALAKRRR